MGVKEVLCILLLLTKSVQAKKILVMATEDERSRFQLFAPIIDKLDERNHDITVLSSFSLEDQSKNVKHLVFEDEGFDVTIDNITGLLHTMANGSRTEKLVFICEQFLIDSSISRLLKAGKQYDLVIIDSIAECGLVVASLVAKQIITLVVPGCNPMAYRSVPSPPSYIPDYLRKPLTNPTYFERLKTFVYVSRFCLVNDFWTEPALSYKIKEYIPEAPTLSEVRRQVAIALVNNDPVLYSSLQSVPRAINCGGLHCRDAKPLPKDLNDFVESSGDDGFILFSGSLTSSYLSEEARLALLTVFSSLKQKVIWKFDKELKDLPENVKIVKWMPQQDLLGHPKIRLFISHFGYLSLQEAIYHGVPVVGFPFFSSEYENAARVHDLEIGIFTDNSSITVDGIYKLIQHVLTDKRYLENVRKFSAIFRDQPDHPVDKAVYWIEQVLFHDVANHFQGSGRQFTCFQYFLLDVGAFLLLGAIIIIPTYYLLLQI